MKNKLQKILAAVAIVLGCFAMIALGQVLKPLPVPATWAASNGNYFRITTAVKPEVRSIGLSIAGAGTNTFTGATTNVLQGEGELTNRLVFVNGILVGITAP